MFSRNAVIGAACVLGLAIPFRLAHLSSAHAAAPMQIKGDQVAAGDSSIGGCTHDMYTVKHGCSTFVSATLVDSVTYTVYGHRGATLMRLHGRAGPYTDAIFISRWAAKNFLQRFYDTTPEDSLRADSLRVQLQHATELPGAAPAQVRPPVKP